MLNLLYIERQRHKNKVQALLFQLQQSEDQDIMIDLEMMQTELDGISEAMPAYQAHKIFEKTKKQILITKLKLTNSNLLELSFIVHNKSRSVVNNTLKDITSKVLDVSQVLLDLNAKIKRNDFETLVCKISTIENIIKDVLHDCVNFQKHIIRIRELLQSINNFININFPNNKTTNMLKSFEKTSRRATLQGFVMNQEDTKDHGIVKSASCTDKCLPSIYKYKINPRL